jgi:hypothetical protein
MALTATDQRSLLVMKSQHTSWKQDTLKFVASFGDQMNCDTDVEEEISDNGASIGNSVTSSTVSSNFLKAEHSINERLRAMVSDLESSFSPILGVNSRVYEFLKEKITSSQQISKDKASSKDSSPSLLLLIDPFLQELPFDALEISNLYKGQVIKDYSIHLFGHRMRSKNSRDIIKASCVRSVVDTFYEDRRPADPSFKNSSLLESYHSLFSKDNGIAGADKWKRVVVGGDSGVSLQQWIEVSSTAETVSNKLLYVNVPGKLSSIWNPNDLSLLNLESIPIVIILDSGNNDASYRRQNTVDNKKSEQDLINDSPDRVAALLSLNGANSVIWMQWSTSFSSQNLFSRTFWKYFSNDKHPLLQSYARGVRTGQMFDYLAPKDSATKDAKTKSSPSRPKEYTSKRWIKYSRQFYGLPFNTFDSSA